MRLPDIIGAYNGEEGDDDQTEVEGEMLLLEHV